MKHTMYQGKQVEFFAPVVNDHRPMFEGAYVHPNRPNEIDFEYHWFDSNEGVVVIRYVEIENGAIPLDMGANTDFDDMGYGFDVEVQTLSDVWGLKMTQVCISKAIGMHYQLGHDKLFSRD
jgi:hypothetical protein